MQHATIEHPALRDEVQHFFDAMARAVTHGDAFTLASLWETPALVVSDDGVIAVSRPEELEALFAGAREEYNRRGVMDTRADLVAVDWATDRVCIVEVRWPWLDASGQALGAEASSYAVRRDDDDALRVRAAIVRAAALPH